MDWIEALGWIGSGLTIATYAMKTMVPLRIVAIISGVFYLAYAVIQGLWPLVLTELVLLPFNFWRLWEILSLTRKLKETRHGDQPDFSMLAAYSKAENVETDRVIFRRGDTADRLYYIKSGEVEIEELGVRLGEGRIFGEIAFFTDAAARTATVRTTRPSQIVEVDEATFMKLYFQNPEFGLAVVKTITRRLIEGMATRPDVYQDVVNPGKEFRTT